MPKKNRETYYIVRNRTSGGRYLTYRARPTSTSGKYRWSADGVNVAAPMTESAARSAARRYGGTAVAMSTSF